MTISLSGVSVEDSNRERFLGHHPLPLWEGPFRIVKESESLSILYLGSLLPLNMLFDYLIIYFPNLHLQFLSHVRFFCEPADSSPPGSSDHGTLQARVLEWVAISFSSFTNDFI